MNCGTVSPELVAKFYENQFRKLGGELQFGCEVKRLLLEAKDPLGLPGEPHLWQEKIFKGVETTRGVLSAETIVIATGVRTPALLDPIGVDCLVKPKKRQVFKISGRPAREASQLQRVQRTEYNPVNNTAQSRRTLPTCPKRKELLGRSGRQPRPSIHA